MAVFGEVQHTGNITDIKQVMNYVYQLEEQVRYALGHIGNENMTAECVGIEQLTPGVKQNINQIEINVEAAQNRIRETGNILSNRIDDAEGNISSLQQTATSLTSRVSDTEGNISTLQQTAGSLTTLISNAEGDISVLQQTATSLTSRVGDAEGNISSLQQTATSLTSRIGSAEGDISSLTQTASSISARVSSIETNGTGELSNTAVTIDTHGVEIKSTGTLKVNMTNFKINSSGSVSVTGAIEATSGSIGSFDIINDGLGSLNRKVMIMQDQISVGAVADRGFIADGSGIKAKALLLYDSGTGSYRDVTAAILALL